jgi:hypothetical protein
MFVVSGNFGLRFQAVVGPRVHVHKLVDVDAGTFVGLEEELSAAGQEDLGQLLGSDLLVLTFKVILYCVFL